MVAVCQDLAKAVLRGARGLAVDIGCVKERDAKIERFMDDLARRLAVDPVAEIIAAQPTTDTPESSKVSDSPNNPPSTPLTRPVALCHASPRSRLVFREHGLSFHLTVTFGNAHVRVSRDGRRCLMPLILPFIGALFGAAIGGSTGGVWRTAIGFVAGLVIAGAITWLFPAGEGRELTATPISATRPTPATTGLPTT